MTQKQIISLGEQLVDSLGKGYDVGPVSRWMSHYIAEQMGLAEASTGEDRIKAQQHCFETILKLWSQRATIPGSGRPFRKFQPIFDVLERLDLNSPSFYHMRSRFSSEEEPDEDVANIIKIVQSIEETAQTLIRTFLGMAVTLCKDDATLGYLQAAQEDMQSEDAQAIFRILSDLGSDNEPTDKQIERDKRHLEALDRFGLFAVTARKILGAKDAKKTKKPTKLTKKKGASPRGN